MEFLLTAFRWVHIISGGIAFLAAPAAMATRKGRNAHRRFGKLFFWSMVLTTGSALVMALAGTNYFLFMISIFSFYLAFSGYRVLYRKRPQKGQTANWLDWLVLGLTCIICVIMIAVGVINISQDLSPVLIIFGLIGCFVALSDLVSFVRYPKGKNQWLYTHMQNMIAAYIATLTAFSVVNIDFLPLIIRWLWPTVVFTPVIVVWVNQYKKRFKANPFEPERSAMEFMKVKIGVRYKKKTKDPDDQPTPADAED